jgi:hypothetical protein
LAYAWVREHYPNLYPSEEEYAYMAQGAENIQALKIWFCDLRRTNPRSDVMIKFRAELEAAR